MGYKTYRGLKILKCDKQILNLHKVQGLWSNFEIGGGGFN